MDLHLTPLGVWHSSSQGSLIVSVAAALVILCPDTPTGKWSERTQAAENNLRQHNVQGTIVDVPGTITAERKGSDDASKGTESPTEGVATDEKKLDDTRGTFADNEAQLGEMQMIDTARGEIIEKPGFAKTVKVMFSPQTLVVGALLLPVHSVPSSASTVFLESTSRQSFRTLAFLDLVTGYVPCGCSASCRLLVYPLFKTCANRYPIYFRPRCSA